MEIGEILREARETNNLSLDDIQETTKIQKRYLVAIEQNDFHALPGRFYARAFIKEYAQAVHLDTAELLKGFDEENIETKEEESVQYTRLERSKRPKTAKGASIFSLLPSVIVIILVIGIIFVAWTLYQKTLTDSNVNVENQQENDEIIRNENDGNDQAEEDEEEKDASKEDEEVVEGDEPETEETEGNAAYTVVEAGTGKSPLSTIDFNYSTDKAEVTFDVSATTYVELNGDSGEVFYSGTLEPDMEIDSFEVSAEERIYFNIGNAPGLTISINGAELEYPVDSNDYVHQKLWVNLIND